LKLAQRDVDQATTDPTLEGVLERRLTATALIARNVFAALTDYLWQISTLRLRLRPIEVGQNAA